MKVSVKVYDDVMFLITHDEDASQIIFDWLLSKWIRLYTDENGWRPQVTPKTNVFSLESTKEQIIKTAKFLTSITINMVKDTYLLNGLYFLKNTMIVLRITWGISSPHYIRGTEREIGNDSKDNGSIRRMHNHRNRLQRSEQRNI